MLKAFSILILTLFCWYRLQAQETYYISAYAPPSEWGRFYRFDPATCEVTPFSTCGAGTDIAITSSGRIFVSTFDYVFELLDTETCDVTPPLYVYPVDMGGLNALIAISDHELIAASLWGDVFYINVDTGEAALMGNTVDDSAGDLAYYNGKFYMPTESGTFCSFTVDLHAKTIENVETVADDDFFYFDMYGLTTFGTLDCQGTDLRFLGFKGSSVYEIDPLTYESTLFCPSLDGLMVRGVMSTIDTKIKHYEESNITLPNVFTPNNDGINDVFTIISETGVTDADVTILNRWGNVVYSTKSANAFFWDGYDNENRLCSEGVYFYRIFLHHLCDQPKLLSGMITLEK